MNRLTYFLQLMGKSKYYSGSQCNECGSIPMLLNEYHYLGYEFLNMCHSKHCPSNKRSSVKGLSIKMIDLFEEFRIFDGDYVSFQMTSEREYNLCLKFLYEINHTYECIDRRFFKIRSNITRTQWYEYLYKVNS
ncbi:hypothetical protein [Thalassotalea sp. SU-HH00458]|uniref:hypothetical protein n=1 Tax=Thalassotalea sp. SU-HH00458 TaxID=3127657 RepID=UPI003102FE32